MYNLYHYIHVCMHTVCSDQISLPPFLPCPPTTFPSQIYPHHHTNTLLSPVSVTCMCMGLGPFPVLAAVSCS